MWCWWGNIRVWYCYWWGIWGMCSVLIFIWRRMIGRRSILVRWLRSMMSILRIFSWWCYGLCFFFVFFCCFGMGLGGDINIFLLFLVIFVRVWEGLFLLWLGKWFEILGIGMVLWEIGMRRLYLWFGLLIGEG